jgi:hypothetical protein
MSDSYLFVAVVLSASVAIASCTPTQRADARTVIHDIDKSTDAPCEVLPLLFPEAKDICWTIDTLAPILEQLLSARKEARDATIEIRFTDGRRVTRVIPKDDVEAVLSVVSKSVGVVSSRRQEKSK